MATYLTGYKTAAAGTEITSVCPPRENMIAVLRGFSYTAAATLHNLYAMKCLGMTTTASFTASGATTMELAKLDVGESSAAEDEDLAASDWVVYQLRHGGYEARKVSSVSGSTLTISATSDDVDNGAKVYAFYEVARTCHKQIRCAASTTRIFDDLQIQGGIPYQDGGEIAVSGIGMPMLVVVDNATNAGFLEYVSYEWVEAGEEFLQ